MKEADAVVVVDGSDSSNRPVRGGGGALCQGDGVQGGVVELGWVWL